MKYLLAVDKEYKGFDITIYHMENDTFISDVKTTGGELIYGWELLSSFDLAMKKAVGFVDSMEFRGVAA